MVDSKDMGLYEEGCLGDLFRFRIGMMMASFQVDGILLWSHEVLKI